MTLETLARKIDRLEKLLLTTQQTQWVRMSTVVKETGMSKTWVTEQRKKNESIAIKEGSDYRYDLNKYKQLAA